MLLVGHIPLIQETLRLKIFCFGRITEYCLSEQMPNKQVQIRGI